MRSKHKKQAEINAATEWAKAVRRSIDARIRSGKTFTSDDVRTAVEKRGYVTHNNSAIGAIISAYQTMGRIKPTGKKAKSQVPACRQRKIHIWQAA